MRRPEEEAVQADAYLEGLLARIPTGPLPLADVAPEALDPDLRRAVDLLRATLVRFHPSFRFEESLAARLRAEALPGATEGTLVPFPANAATTAVPALSTPRGRGPLLVGGAIASGFSLAGAALVAWRLARPSSPFARAVRAAHRARRRTAIGRGAAIAARLRREDLA
ncbi:MAG TPA: hypothetical protein VFK38_08020 [Candidatus Limnocylindrales bacterium]|nr:hypothetical protein [Candidatus Limnocylindrales bacterium]